MSGGSLAAVTVATLSLAALAIGDGSLVTSARAQTWNTSAGNWGTAGNWTPATVPNAVGATATFNDTNPGVGEGVNLGGGPFTVGTLKLNGPQDSGGYAFNGGTLIMQAASGQAQINVQTNFGSDFGNVGATALQLNSTTNIDTAPSAIIGFVNNATISGTGGLVFSGSGTAILAVANTYSGGTTISGGIVAIGNSSAALGAGGVIFSGASTLEDNSSMAITNNISLNSGVSATIAAAGGDKLTLNGSLTLGAGSTLNVGGASGSAVDLGSALTIGSGETLSVTSGGSLNSPQGITNNGTINVAQGGSISDFLVNTGAVNNSGGYSADLVNVGSTAVVTNLSTGVWTGNVLSNVSGATIDNFGTWISTSVSSNAGGTIENETNATWQGAIDNGDIFDNASGATVTGLVTNSGTATNEGALAGGADNIAGTFTNNAGGQINGVTNSATFVNNAMGDVASLINDGGLFTNEVNGAVGVATINAGEFDNSGSVNSVTNSAIFKNSGSVSLGVDNTGGTFTNEGGGVVTGGLANNSGIAINLGTIDDVVNSATFDNQSGGKVTGLLTNSATATNEGMLQGGVSNTGGTFTNNSTGTVVGGLSNTGGAAYNLGTIDTVTNSATFDNQSSGVVTGLLTNLGTATNEGMLNGGVANTSGTFTNNTGGAVTGGLSNTGGNAFNAGTIDTVTNSATFENRTGGIVTGLLTNTAGTATNDAGGTIGPASVSGGTLNNSGAVMGLVTVDTGGIFNNSSTGVVNGGLTNGVTGNGIVNAAGAIDGAITNNNASSFNVTGTLAGNNTFTNSGTATLTVDNSATYSGVTTLTNNSTSATAVTVNATGSITATTEVLNTAGTFANAGTLTAPTIMNTGGMLSNSGTINALGVSNTGGTLATTGVVNAFTSITNSATMTAAGTITTPLMTNTGAFALTGNLGGAITAFDNNDPGTLAVGAFALSGVGTLTNNSTSANAVTVAANGSITATSIASTAGTITNGGTLNGTTSIAISGGTLANNTGGTVNTALLSTTGAGTINNAGTINAGSPIQNGGTFDSLVGGVANGGLTNLATGTVSASGGAINGPVDNKSANFTVSGPVTGNSTFLNESAATLTVIPAGSYALAAVLTNAGTINTAGTLNLGGLANSGTVTASAGAVNGPIENQNNGVFAVTGAVSSNSTFLNELGAQLNVNSGAYTLTGLLTNSGAVSVLGPATLNASTSGIANLSGGSIVNRGTVNDALNNAGLVNNYGFYNADVANSGTINNNAGATWNGNVTANSGTITNFSTATWTGTVGSAALGNTGTITNYWTWDGSGGTGVSYNTSGTIDNEALWKGSLYNNGGTLLNNGMINGNVTANGGIVDSYGPNSVITGNVALTGAPAVVNALGTIGGNVTVPNNGNGVFNVSNATGSLLAPGSHYTLNVGGNVTGPITIPINLTNGASNFIQVAGSTTGASTNLSGVLTNPQNLLWANSTLKYSNASVPLSGSSTLLLLGASSTGFYQYTPVNNNSIVQSLKLGTVSAPANQVTSIITALTSSFFSNASAFLGTPVNPTPNMWYGGIWTRGGGAETTTETTSTGGGAPSAVNSETSRFSSSIGGVQFGIDEGLYNINNSGWNGHFGITGGEGYAFSSLQYSTSGEGNVSTSATVPFVGLYAALTGNNFTGTLQWRHSNYDLNLTNPFIGASNQELNAHGETFSADAAYTYAVAPGYYVSPSAAVFVSHTNVNNLDVNEAFAQNTEFTFDALKSTLGRFGARASTVYTFNDNLLLAPFVAANVWHEFQGGSTTAFYQGVATITSPVPPVVSSSLGTFGQFSVGFSTQSPKSGLTSYVQGDVRVGSNVQGWGITGGLRYSY